MVQLKNQPVYTKLKPVTDARALYDGFDPGRKLLKKGYVYEAGRKPFPADTYCYQDTAITLRDGVHVYADIYMPVDGGQYPAIVCWGPAGKRGVNNMMEAMAKGMPPVEEMVLPEGEPPFEPKEDPRMGIPFDATSGLQAWECHDPAYWAAHGYAMVNVDPRGVYMSEGNVRYLGPDDGEDAYDVIEWCAAQDWCTGKVAMSGCSWYGMTQFYTAMHKPPHLVCIAPQEAHGDLYREEYVKGGIPMEVHGEGVDRTYGAGEIENIYLTLQKYPMMNDYWESKVCPFEDISIPMYLVACFASQIHLHGTLDAWQRYGGSEKWLRIHRTQEWVDLWDPEKVEDLRRFFDHYLKGIDNGWEFTPRVRMPLMDFAGTTVEDREEGAFPLARERHRALYLDASDCTLKAEKPERNAVASYNSEKRNETGRLEFTMEIDADFEMIGYPELKLWVEAQGADDMDIFVRLLQLDEDDNILFYNSYMYKYTGPDARLRASHRALSPERSRPYQPMYQHTQRQLLHPGEVVELDIGLWPTSMQWHKGQKLKLVIAGYDYCPYSPGDRPRGAPDNHGLHLIHTGGDFTSELLIPIA